MQPQVPPTAAAVVYSLDDSAIEQPSSSSDRAASRRLRRQQLQQELQEQQRLQQQQQLCRRPSINTSQLHQSRVGLLSQALMMMITVGFMFSETLEQFWKTKYVFMELIQIWNICPMLSLFLGLICRAAIRTTSSSGRWRLALPCGSPVSSGTASARSSYGA